jgi:DNA-binding NarL/FixJ family response regulator
MLRHAPDTRTFVLLPPRPTGGQGADVSAPRPRLTIREQHVLRALASGATYAAAAAHLGVSTNTIRAHVRAIYRKLAVRSKTAAVVLALRERLMEA